MDGYNQLQEGDIYNEYDSVVDAEKDLEEVWHKNKPEYLIIQGKLYQKINQAQNILFKKLTPEEEQDYRNFVNEDKQIKDFIKKASCFHPVVRDEICKRLLK